jgi:murein DD-endopeptidase MepM/ murein hydrolase activator NlpD
MHGIMIPELGRFLQADPMLDGLNRYTYCGNNPVRYSDPTGFGAEDAETSDDLYDAWQDAEIDALVDELSDFEITGELDNDDNPGGGSTSTTTDSDGSPGGTTTTGGGSTVETGGSTRTTTTTTTTTKVQTRQNDPYDWSGLKLTHVDVQLNYPELYNEMGTISLYDPLSLLDRYYETSPYGYRVHPITGGRKFHTGIDYSTSLEGLIPVYAAGFGSVGKHPNWGVPPNR